MSIMRIYQYVILTVALGSGYVLYHRCACSIKLQKQESSAVMSPSPKHLGGRYDAILKACGDLCNLEKPIQPGQFLGHVKAKIDCEAIFASDEIDRPSGTAPVPWEEIPQNIQDQFSHFGKVLISQIFIDETQMGSGRSDSTLFTKDDVQVFVDAFLAGTPLDTYGGNSSFDLSRAADFLNITGKTVLVIGTQLPWLEAILITKKPALIVTLEYGLFTSQYPGLEFITPKVFRAKYADGSLPVFDVVFTYSSVEHSGLGRYGDAINPWGDILTIARAWCVSSPDAKLVIGVPTAGIKDKIDFNAHRIYGPVLYPFLTTNWQWIWSSDGSTKQTAAEDDLAGYRYQPVYIFEKNL